MFSRSSGLFVGLAREMPMCEPPRKWMRLTSSMVSGMTCSMSPCISHSKPSRMPSDLDAVEAGADRRGADDAVDAGGGPAADENRQLAMMGHAASPLSPAVRFSHEVALTVGPRDARPSRLRAPRP